MNANHRLLPALAVAGLLAACSRQAPPPEPLRAVRTVTLTDDSAGGTQEFAAEVRARTESRLGFRVGGKLISRSAEVGQHVRSGQVLARLDATDLRLGAQAAQAGAGAAQASVALAAAEFKRYQELRAQGFISALELERRETALKAQQAQLEQARAQAAVQGHQAAYAALTAHVAGVVTAVDAEPGAVLAAGTPVLRLAHDGPRDVVFTVPEDGLAAMRALLGRAGAVKVKPWAGTTPLPATVREVAAAADPVTRTFLVKADLAGAALQLGQTATVLIDLPRREAIHRLPLSAVMQQQGQAAVWLLDRETMTVKLQPVAVSGADANSLIVAAGLSAGQTVVVAGVHTLSAGQKVKLYDAPASPPPRLAVSAAAALPAASR
jgi:RND family efflux transporter MFP subunit